MTVTIDKAKAYGYQAIGRWPVDGVAIAVVGGMSKAQNSRMQMLLEIGALFWDRQPSSRPKHRGTFKAAEYCHRHAQPYMLNFHTATSLKIG
jgi:hypothetical protein